MFQGLKPTADGPGDNLSERGARWWVAAGSRVRTGRRPRLAVVERRSARGGAEQQQRAAPGERLAGAARGAHLLPRCQCCPARCLRQALGAGVALRAAVGRGARGAAELAPQVPRASLPGAGGCGVSQGGVAMGWGRPWPGVGGVLQQGRRTSGHWALLLPATSPHSGREEWALPDRQLTAAAKSGPSLA